MQARAGFDRTLLAELYRRYASDLAGLAALDRDLDRLGRAVHAEARRVLYLMVRHVAPDVVVEISPKHGLSTLHIALALEHNGRGHVRSFELRWRRLLRARDNVRRHRLDHRVRFVYGDAREAVGPAVRDLDGLGFLFLDSDHGPAFARWYLGALFPFVRRGGVIHVDDILTDPRAAAPPPDVGLEPTGEEREVSQALLAQADRYVWFSLADCLRDPAHVEAVRPFVRGDLPGEVAASRAGRATPAREWNPSLWILKTGEQESPRVVDVPFEPVRRTGRRWLAHAWRRRRARALGIGSDWPGG